MKQADDLLTRELPGLDQRKRGRGRPPKADALTPAERARRYRYKKLGEILKAARDLAKLQRKAAISDAT